MKKRAAHMGAVAALRHLVQENVIQYMGSCALLFTFSLLQGIHESHSI